jgi:hypothetical protein
VCCCRNQIFYFLVLTCLNWLLFMLLDSTLYWNLEDYKCCFQIVWDFFLVQCRGCGLSLAGQVFSLQKFWIIFVCFANWVLNSCCVKWNFIYGWQQDLKDSI